MPTFEDRKPADGRITAIRVKVRRAGQAHLSRTFPVSARGHSDVPSAEVAARDWLGRLELAGGPGTPGQRQSIDGTLSDATTLAAMGLRDITPLRTAEPTASMPSPGS